MKIQTAPDTNENIAGSVKARHIARIADNVQTQEKLTSSDNGNNITGTPILANDRDIPTSNKENPQATVKVNRTIWTNQERRLFFQALRLFGKNFNEITKFVCARPVRTEESGVSSNSTVLFNKTREQIRFFYMQTWYKIRRFIKLPDIYPQHIKEVYALVNYSVLKSKVKKPLDSKLGEKLNELILTGQTTIRQACKNFIIRTPVCPALKKLNNISCPSHFYRLPEDCILEIIPCSQNAASFVSVTENNPRIRLKVDINRQLCDVISLLEAKWINNDSRICKVLEFHANSDLIDDPQKEHFVALRIDPDLVPYGVVTISEIPKTRSCDLSLNSYIKRNVEQKQISSNDGEISIKQDMTISGLAWETVANKSSRNQDSLNNSPQQSLNLEQLVEKLKSGIVYETSREVKILSVYLALGCPDKIVFEYDIVHSVEYHNPLTPHKTPIEHSQNGAKIYTTAFVDPGGMHISNGLRRLLHLSSCDFLDFAGLLTDNISSPQTMINTEYINHFMNSTPFKNDSFLPPSTIKMDSSIIAATPGAGPSEKNSMLNEALNGLLPPTPGGEEQPSAPLGLVLLSTLANNENSLKDSSSTDEKIPVLRPDVMNQSNSQRASEFTIKFREPNQIVSFPTSSNGGSKKMPPVIIESVQNYGTPVNINVPPKGSIQTKTKPVCDSAISALKEFHKRSTRRRVSHKNKPFQNQISIKSKPEIVEMPTIIDLPSCDMDVNNQWSNISIQANDTLNSLLNSVGPNSHEEELLPIVMAHQQLVTTTSTMCPVLVPLQQGIANPAFILANPIN